MPAWLLPVLAAAAGAIGGAKKNKTQQTQSSTSTPTFDPSMSGLKSTLMRNIMGRVGQGSSFGAGLKSNAIMNANQVFGNLQQNQENRLASAGLAGSPVAASGALNLDVARGGAINTRLNEIPVLEEENNQENLGLAQNFLRMGMGSKSTGTGTTDAGGGGVLGALGGGLDGLAAMLGFQYGQKPKKKSILDSFSVS